MCTSFLYSKSINLYDSTLFIKFLSQSKIYIDHTKSLTLEQIIERKIAFQDNQEDILTYGFSPNFDLWIKFTLNNKSLNSIEKIIEYNNPLTTHLQFFAPDINYKIQEDGLFMVNPSRKTINPTFRIKLDPNETKTYYIKISSNITTLIVRLNLWDIQKFYEHEIKHQLILALFFGAMTILAFYNFFIYLFTRDISYLFYFLYILGVVIHHLIYIGFGTIYLLNQQWIIYCIKYASLITSFPIFALALFTKTFLQTKQYPFLNTIINIFLILLPISVILFISTDQFNKYRNILAVVFLAYILYITIYAVFKKNRQAYLLFIGWSAIFVAILLMLLSSTGIFDIYQYYPYLIETGLIFEATIFSIALANRIKQLQSDKELVNKQLLLQQQNEKSRLFYQVEEKTYNLKVALDEKELLLKELNHRVKNNLQIIISLIRLQSDEIADERLKDVLATIQNRINSMCHLHELLYKKNSILYINIYDYFDLLLEDIQESYSKNTVTITMDIQTELKIDQAIYCGMILNELVTNSFKYAFLYNQGNIHIKLNKKQNTYYLSICDNGVGYTNNYLNQSFGLILVNTLVKEQLKGTINTYSHNGVKVKIAWEDNDKN